jgi:predicted porin
MKHKEETMKRTVRAIPLAILAIATFASEAQAQSSVTLFGNLDAGLLYTNKTVNNANGKNAGSQIALINGGEQPSTFGLQGTEDLGGGLKAIFALESGISLANGGYDDDNGGIFGRQAWVGLSGDFGTAKMGLQYSTFNVALWKTDARGLDSFDGSNSLLSDSTTGTGAYVSNAISYSSPVFAGFTGAVMLALGNVAGDFQAGRAWSGSLSYAHGGLLVNAAFLSVADTPSTADEAYRTPAENREVSASYTFGKATVTGSFVSYDEPENITNNVRLGGRNLVYNVGFDYYVQPDVELISSLLYAKDPHESASHSLLAAVGAQYLLSKTTLLYAEVGITNNRGTENIGISVEGAFTSVLGTTTGVSVGIIKNF